MKKDFQGTVGMRFRNDSSEDIPPFAIMDITGTIVDAAGQPFLTVAQPSSTFKHRYAINGPFKVAAGKFNFIREGIVWAAYDGSGTPSFGTVWGAKSGQWTLSQNRDGFSVYGASNTSKQRTLVEQFFVTKIIGKLDGDLNSGSSGSAKIWVRAGGAEAVSEYSITIQDWLIPSGRKIVDKTKIIALYVNGVWYLSEAGDCSKPQ